MTKISIFLFSFLNKFQVVEKKLSCKKKRQIIGRLVIYISVTRSFLCKKMLWEKTNTKARKLYPQIYDEENIEQPGRRLRKIFWDTNLV